MKIKEVTEVLEARFPLSLQEDFDNCGIQCGDDSREITGALVCFEMSEEVLDEASAMGANLVLSHHPLMLRRGINKITPNDRAGKLICKALARNMVLYSMHTNVDAAEGGGNDVFAEKMGLKNVSVLEPLTNMYRKIVFFAPAADAGPIKQALFAAGAGQSGNYDQCCYTMTGQGSFRPLEKANPYLGKVNEKTTVGEERVEIVFPAGRQRQIIRTLYENHPYEEPAFDIVALENPSRREGLGRIGFLPEKMTMDDFLQYVKAKMQLQHFKYYGDERKMIEKVAVCGGGGASLIGMAVAAGADAYVCGDIKYHDFINADKKILLCDIGHYESEFFIREIIYREITEKFSTFATAISKMENLGICTL